MKTTYKEHSIVMLATEDKTHIKLDTDVSRLWYDNTPMSTEIHIHQHLYVTSAEEIREGEYYIVNNIRIQEVRKAGCTDSGIKDKVIATTDKHLTTEQVKLEGVGGRLIKHNLLPQIPQSFIESYCKNPVDKVLVEYVNFADDDQTWGNGLDKTDLRLKLVSNTISISIKS